MKWISAAVSPFGFVLVMHKLCTHVGMTENEATAASILVWLSCVGMLILVLAAIAEAKHRRN
jgi:hypothetical protein